MAHKTEKSAPPRLRLFANLWTLWDHPGAGNEWTLEEKVVAIRDAGFDGFACHGIDVLNVQMQATRRAAK